MRRQVIARAPKQGPSGPAEPPHPAAPPHPPAPPQAAEQEAEIGGILGQAMRRARHTPFLGTAQRDEFRGGARNLFRSGLGRAAWMFVVLMAAAVTAGVVGDNGTWGLVAGVVLVLGYVAENIVGRLLPAAWTGIVVGADGIVVRGRFLHYSKIAGARHVHRSNPGWSSPFEAETTGGAAESVVSIRLHEGEVIDIALGSDAAVAAGAIEEARATWLDGRHGSAIDEDMIARHERSGADWLEALRRLSGGSTSAYRSREVDREHVARLLDDVRARPSSRAAAAVVLAALGDATAGAKLRIAAGSIVDPQVRIRLERVADAGEDDEALAEALEALHEADFRERA